MRLKKNWARDRTMFSIVDDGLKYISRPTRPPPEHHQLFDLRTDPKEKHDLIGDPAHRKRVIELSASLRRIANENLLGLEIVNRPVQLTDEEVRNLEALGYID